MGARKKVIVGWARPNRRIIAGIAGVVVLSVSPASPASAESLRWVVDSIARGSDSSIAVAAGGALLYERDAARKRAPASVQKLLLTMALFDEFGPAHRITTRAMTRSVTDGAVDDLWVVGGGDPTVVSGGGGASHTGVGELARRIAGSGIRTVTGRVIADASLFEHDWDAPGWQPWAQSFVAQPTALALDANSSADPPRAFAGALTKVLERRGIRVGKPPAIGTAPDNAMEVARVRSIPLASMVRTMNETSSNFTAEMLGKLLGAKTLGAPGTISKGARAIEKWADRQGVTIVAHDSSGLSYENGVAAIEVVQLLEVARRRPWGRALYRALPSPGEGTLAARLPGIDVHAKTGTIWSGDSALAGWVKLSGGGIAEFAILTRDESKSLEDAVVRAVASEARVLPARRIEGRFARRHSVPMCGRRRKSRSSARSPVSWGKEVCVWCFNGTRRNPSSELRRP
jgi:D-alanyl-D-alanine carboxypeptidase/D-alanyl-D-alanine-endopeptidase (penicillin-binding protein 4)